MRMLLFFLFPLLLLAEEGGRINLHAGRLQEIPVPVAEGEKWELIAEHGRLLGEGTGKASVQVAELEPGTSLDAIFKTGKNQEKLRFWSFPLLSFEIQAESSKLERIFNTQLRAGTVPPEKEPVIVATEHIDQTVFKPQKKIFLVFPDKSEFPLDLVGKWEGISLHRAKISGTLGVILEKKERTLNLDGDFSYAILRRGPQKVIVFSPGFEFDEIENIVLIRKLLQEKQK